MDFIYSKIFMCSYKEFYQDDKLQKICANINQLIELEEVLKEFIYGVIGFRFSHKYDYGEIRAYFDNICQNTHFYDYHSLIKAINEYKNRYIHIMDSHPYVMLLTDAIKRIYSPEYDGKLGFNISSQYEYVVGHNATINHKGSMMQIRKNHDSGEVRMPNVFISDIDKLEDSLEEYVEAIKSSNSFYNLFNNKNFNFFTYNEKVKMLFEATILNASTLELSNLTEFFNKYRDFIIDETLPNMTKLQKMGDTLNDEMYFCVKRSDIEYETPYYFSFMLKNSYYELPNVRLGITSNGDKKIAHIIATQTSQFTPENEDISKMIKKGIPHTSKFRFSNPDYLVSILIAFGILKGMGIENVVVEDYMPLRSHKTIRDKSMGEEESNRYMERIYDKEIYTYLKLSELCNGIDIKSFPDDGNNMNIALNDNITCANEFLQNLYNMAYNFGKNYKVQDQEESLTHC